MLQRTSSYYQADVDKLKIVASTLSSLKQAHPDLIDFNIEKFIQDVMPLDGLKKNFTQERCVKLITSIKSLYSSLDLDLSGDTLDLLFGFESIIKSDSAKCFYESSSLIHQILEDSPKREFEKATLYFIDEVNREELQKIKDELEITHEKSPNKIDSKRYSFSKLLNFLNMDEVSHKYDIKYFPIFQHISKEKSIEKYLPSNYEVWKNSFNKKHREFMKTHSFDSVTKKRIEQEHELELKKAQEEYGYLIDNLSNVKVKIITASHADTYPTLTYSLKKRTKNRYLKLELPNALWFAPEPYREDWDAIKFIEKAHHAFGDVYYI